MRKLTKDELIFLLAWLILLVFGPLCWGQTASIYTDRAVGTFPVGSGSAKISVLIPVQFGQVRVCSLPLTQSQPCLPLATITDVFGNPISNAIGGSFGQLTTDVVGRFSFGCSSGTNLQLQVAPTASNTPQLNYPISCGIGPGGAASLSSLTITEAFNANPLVITRTDAGGNLYPIFTAGSNAASVGLFICPLIGGTRTCWFLADGQNTSNNIEFIPSTVPGGVVASGTSAFTMDPSGNGLFNGALRLGGDTTTVIFRNGGSGFVGVGTAIGTANGTFNLHQLLFDTGNGSAQVGSTTNPPATFFYQSQYFRSGGNPAFPDISGNQTNPLIIAGKSDGSGIVQFGVSSAPVATKVAIGSSSNTLTFDLLQLIGNTVRMYFGTASGTHTNWKIAAQDAFSDTLEIDNGTANADPTISTYTNVFKLSSGGTLALPSAGVFSLNGDTGLSRIGANIWGAGNGTPGDTSADFRAASLRASAGTSNGFEIDGAIAGAAMGSNVVLSWTSGSSSLTGDTSLWRGAANVVGVGTGGANFGGTLKATTVNVVSNLQANGSNGSNGNCLVNSAGVTTWGTCVGVTAPQINTTTVTANANSAVAQNLMSVTFGAGVFNTVGKTWTYELGGALSTFVNTTETVTFNLQIGGSNIATFVFVPGSTNGFNWHIHGICTVTQAGATGQATCSSLGEAGTVTTAVTYQQPTSNFGGQAIGNLANAVTMQAIVTFGTASTSNSINENLLVVIPNN